MGWIDLRTEPVVFTIPEIEKERFYQVQLIDIYAHNFAYISTVATGNGLLRSLLRYNKILNH